MTSDPTDEPARVIARLEAEAAELRMVTSQKDRFLATFSHEIRSPMNGVFGMADALSRTVLDGQQRRYLDILHQACESMLGIANQALDISRFESGLTELVPVDFNLVEMLTALLAEYAGQAKARGIELELDTKIMTDSRIRCDKLRLRQVLANLISNALRYTDKGRIVVRAILQPQKDGPQNRLLLSVEDSGIGIPLNKHKQIFEAFVSADNGEAVLRGGTGLGLSIVRDILFLMSGSIKVDSTVGQGSVFTVEILVDPATATTETSRQYHRPMPGSLRVLLAEDNDSNAFIFTVLLEDTGVEITRARHGKEAVELVQRHEFDMIFMDIQMPHMNGIDAAREIRLHPFADKVPIIIALTADVFAQQSSAFRDAGFDAVLTKPVRQSDLLDALSVSYGSEND